MRFFTFLVFGFATLQVVLSLPLDNPTRIVSDLVARGPGGKKGGSKKYVPPAPPHITFMKGKGPGTAHYADNHFKALNLYSNKRKAVEDYHRKVVDAHMKTIPGAHTAEIKNLAHSAGSKDKHPHISAVIKDKQGNIITAPRQGNPNIQDPTHHIYVDKKTLPSQYTKAVDKHLISQGKKPGTI